MDRMDIADYRQDIEALAGADCWGPLKDATVLLSGATGLIGTFFLDAVAYKNAHDGLNCHVIAIGRNRERAKARFPYFDEPWFSFQESSIEDLDLSVSERIDVIFHLASNTHPLAYASDPIGTVTSNLEGLRNLLELAAENGSVLVFASSVEVYGENRGDVDLFDEEYCGYIDCNTLRACYPESKRMGEALCQAYAVQKDVRVRIPRLSRIYGPTVLPSDSKASTQFIKNGINKEPIVLKSEGKQNYSYLYVADAVEGMLTILDRGEDGQAYNLADAGNDTTLKNLATLIASVAGTEVVFDLPNAVEAAGFSKATKALLDPTKAQSLGWHARHDLEDGMRRTIGALSDLWR